MKIKDFVNEVNKVANESIKTNRINGMLKTKNYISVAQKIDLADRVTKVTTHKYDNAGNAIGFEVHSPSKFLLHTMGLVDLYTDLDVDMSNIMDEYDLLNSNGLIEVILNSIGETEIAECEMFLDMIWHDTIQNELSPYAFIQNQVTRFGTLAGVTMSSVLEGLTKAIENLDDDKVRVIVDALGNMRK